jgi:hypothetical protein
MFGHLALAAGTTAQARRQRRTYAATGSAADSPELRAVTINDMRV